MFPELDSVRGTELWAMSRSAIHRALNLPEPGPDVLGSEGPAQRQREAADESRAFLPPLEGDPDELEIGRASCRERV